MEIVADDALTAWKELLHHVVQKGARIHYREQNAVECLNVLTTVKNPSKRPEEPIASLNSLGRWLYPSIEEISDCLLSAANADYIYTYGQRLFMNDKTNQVDGFIIPLLKENSMSGRAVVATWDIRKDSVKNASEVPGIVSMDFKLRGGALHVTSIIRNNDVFFGWPANFYQTHTIQRYVANRLGVPVGTLTTLSCSAHVYEDSLQYAKKILGRRLRA
ncbi:MAG: hypothetical protein HY366_00725 [Candidatus Aenigmarchaeota archaeon]|nr:hypothetical protein [Candidatus Aenigmarchaeota archaeon]